MISFIEELDAYTCNFGLVHNKPQDNAEPSQTVSQNGLCFTAEALLIEQTIVDSESHYFEVIKSVSAYQCFSKAEGILYRHPIYHREGNQLSIDELVGYAAISSLTKNPHLAKELLDSWSERQWKFFGFFRPRFYNPDETQYRTKYSHRAHFLKYPAAIAALEWSAGIDPPLWRQLYYKAAMLWGPISIPDHARVLRLHAACHPNPYYLELANRRVKQKYGSLNELYRRYFNDGGLHPFTRWSL